MSRYEKLTQQPLVVALAEFRFSTILTMEAYVSSFQEHLRKDFPHFVPTETQEMVIDGKGVNISTHESWLFLSSNKKRAFKLDKDRIIFMTSEYDGVEDTWKNCKTALSFIEKKIKPSILLRVGLRYSNLIIAKSENEDIDSYVDSSICNSGQLCKIGEQIHRSKETVLKTDVGLMAVRSLCGNLNLSAWPDLSDPPVVINKYLDPSKRIVLDIDHFWQQEEQAVKFNIELIHNKISSLHEKSREAFWEITTDKGREVWK
ncbi:TIGR04255 family protein [Acinetobacter dispersus]|uniref:TIGR04255 family protein n=1 Tax=Acinetobacter dispersus TaxID=70348 RepID=UPI0021CD1FDE|nr:TIGR04255 family protein [Acinetobacter dispersus]MCU4336100.1 TIGR04255 family protein [Acinetobacter dispersus]